MRKLYKKTTNSHRKSAIDPHKLQKFHSKNSHIPDWTERYEKIRMKQLLEYHDEKETKKKVSYTPKNPDYTIKPLKALKNWDPPLTRAMKEKKIPGHPETSMIIAPIGSGKSTLIGNLLTKAEFYKDYFDEIYLFVESPDPTLIQNVPMLKKTHKKTRVFFNCSPGVVENILQEQESSVKKRGRAKAKRCLIILDDCIGNTKFFFSRPVQTLIFNLRHYNTSVWITAQAYVGVRQRHRMQMLNIFFLKGINSKEKKKIIDEHLPAYLSEKEFGRLIDDALDEPYSFLYIKKNVPDKRQQFRDTKFNVIDVNRYINTGGAKLTLERNALDPPPNQSITEQKTNERRDREQDSSTDGIDRPTLP